MPDSRVNHGVGFAELQYRNILFKEEGKIFQSLSNPLMFSINKRFFRWFLATLSIFCLIGWIIPSSHNKLLPDNIVSITDQYWDVDAPSIDPLSMKVMFPSIAEAISKKTLEKEIVDWNKYAYVNYISSEKYLCNIYAQFKSILKFGSKAKFLALVTPDIIHNDKLEFIRQLAPDQFVVKEVNNSAIEGDQSKWKNSLVKLQVFNLDEYNRIIFMDNDANIQHNLDELFLMPDYIEFAAPVSYWESDVTYPKQIDSHIWRKIDQGQQIHNYLPDLTINEFDRPDIMSQFWVKKGACKARWTSMIMVIKPSKRLYTDLMSYVDGAPGRYDMEYVNDYYDFKKVFAEQDYSFRTMSSGYRPKVVALSMQYAIISRHLREREFHEIVKQGKPLLEAFKEVKFVHFSEDPQPKAMDVDTIDGIECHTNPEDDYICPTWYQIYTTHFELAKECREFKKE